MFVIVTLDSKSMLLGFVSVSVCIKFYLHVFSIEILDCVDVKIFGLSFIFNMYFYKVLIYYWWYKKTIGFLVRMIIRLQQKLKKESENDTGVKANIQ